MTPRLASGVRVSALIRTVEARGGTAAVLARGDAGAGAILLCIAERGVTRALRERRIGPDGVARWDPAGPQDIVGKQEVDAYISRRRCSDPDLWVVELDVADSQRLTVELPSMG